MSTYSALTEYSIKQRIANINYKKMNPGYKANLFNNKMFNKYISKRKNYIKNIQDNLNKTIAALNNNDNDNVKIVYQNLINMLTKQINNNNNMCEYAVKINGIITDLHDVVENASPVINTPEHPFTKMNIERHFMVGTSIQPYVYETEPVIDIDEDNIVSGIWSDRIDITGFVDNNINHIYNLIINNNMCEYETNEDGTVEVKLFQLDYEHINGNVSFIQTMIIDINKKIMTLVKIWDITLNC